MSVSARGLRIYRKIAVQKLTAESPGTSAVSIFSCLTPGLLQTPTLS